MTHAGQIRGLVDYHIIVVGVDNAGFPEVIECLMGLGVP